MVYKEWREPWRLLQAAASKVTLSWIQQQQKMSFTKVGVVGLEQFYWTHRKQIGVIILQ